MFGKNYKYNLIKENDENYFLYENNFFELNVN